MISDLACSAPTANACPELFVAPEVSAPQSPRIPGIPERHPATPDRL